MKQRKMSIRAISLLLAAVILLGCVGTITASASESWTLSDDTGIFWVNTNASEADYDALSGQVLRFAGALAKKVTGDALPISYGEKAEAGENDIILVLSSSADIAEQGFEIVVDGGAVTITAADAAGLLYGCNTLIQQLLTSECVVNTAEAPYVLERALFLDNGRKYYSVDWIKGMIRELAWAKMNTLVIHFSEEMGLGLETKTYPWLMGRDGTLGTQAEVTTDNRYLTQDEMAEIIEYAQKYHVQIVPSFDSPGHMNYIVKKFNEKCAEEDYTFTYDGVEYTAEAGSEIGNYYHYNGQTAIVQGSRNNEYSRGIDISNEVAVAFTRSLIEEYATFFYDQGCTKFDIGGDELLGWGTAIVSTSTASRWKQLDHWKEYAQNRAKEEGLSNWSSAVAYDGFLYYMNDLYDLVTGIGYESVRMWNDDAYRTDAGWAEVVNLNTDIEILYWTDNGNNVWTYGNHSVYNYLSDYNYYAMISDLLGNFPKVTQQQIYEEWSPYIFTDNLTATGKNMSVGNESVKGSAFCIWCDNPDLETEDEVREGVLPLMRANGAKAWDALAHETVSYSTFASNLDKIGNAPSGTAGAEIWIMPDFTALESAVAAYETVDAALYTEESYAAYTTAVEAGSVLLTAKPTQDEVDAATAAIEEAYEALELIPPADTAALEAAIAEYAEMDSTLYTEESFTMYTAAVNAGQSLLDSGVYTQEEVDAALSHIQEQKAALREAETVGGVTCFISGKFKSSKVYVGKVATIAMSVVKGTDIAGFEIYNDLNTTTEIMRHSVSTSKSDRDNHTVLFKPTSAEKGERTYTVYAILGDGTRSADCLTLTLTVK